MTYEVREFARVAKTVRTVSIAAWILLLVPGGAAFIGHHHAGPRSSMLRTMPSHVVLAVLPGISLVLGRVVMLAAMMSPMLIAPLCHIRLRSLRRRRARATILFVAAYVGVWLLIGYLLLAITAAATVFSGGSYLPATIVLFAALAWQFSPAKQRCLNGCHGYSRLAAFGTAADVDALRYGVNHAGWCIGSCWAWMLLPMLCLRGHLLVMAVITILLFCERLEEARSPSWGVRGTRKAARILVAQTRIHLRPYAPFGFTRTTIW